MLLVAVSGMFFGTVVDRHLRRTSMLLSSAISLTTFTLAGLEEGDVDAARALVESTADAELFLYPGDQHYFADSSLPSNRPESAELLRERVLESSRPADLAPFYCP